MTDSKNTITAVIIEDEQCISLEELCQAINAEPKFVVELIEHELITPQGKSDRDWVFDEICLRRSKKAMSFKHDLNVNLEGIALALDLLDRIDSMQSEMVYLQKLLRE